MLSAPTTRPSPYLSTLPTYRYLKWSTPYRLRHLLTGRYLCARRDLDIGDMHSFTAGTCLASPGEPGVTDASLMSFRPITTPERDYLGSNLVSLRVQHQFPDDEERMRPHTGGGKGWRGWHREEGWLHASQLPRHDNKGNLIGMFTGGADPTDLTSLNDTEGKEDTDEDRFEPPQVTPLIKVGSGSRRVGFAMEVKGHDAWIMSVADDDEVADAELIMSYVAVVENYTSVCLQKKGKFNSIDAVPMQRMLSRLALGFIFNAEKDTKMKGAAAEISLSNGTTEVNVL